MPKKPRDRKRLIVGAKRTIAQGAILGRQAKSELKSAADEVSFVKGYKALKKLGKAGDKLSKGRHKLEALSGSGYRKRLGLGPAKLSKIKR